MKKILLTITVMLALAATEVYATPFLISPLDAAPYDEPTNTSYSINGYTIIDRSSSLDQWVSSVGGYKSTIAAPTSSTYNSSYYTGYYLGTVADNNDNGDVVKLVNYYLTGTFSTSSTYELLKSDETSPAGKVLILNNLVLNDDQEAIFGSWSTVGSNPTINVAFYSVKSANEYALYLVDPADDFGYWTTAHLLTPNGKNIPSISHLTVATESASPVPEPATMLLFGAGLAGLAGIARRKVQ